MSLKTFSPLRAQQKLNIVKGSAGVMTIVLSKKNGKRVVLSRLLVEELELDNKVRMITDGKKVILSKEALSDEYSEYGLKTNKGRKIIYCASLAQELTDIFDLDFDNVVSRTVSDVVFEVDDTTGIKYAIVGGEEVRKGG